MQEDKMDDKLKNRYNQIFSGSKRFVKNIRIKQHVPKPTEKDYARQVIKRFFVQKANDENGVIYEIDKNQKSKFQNNPTYNFVELDWKISGDSETKTVGDFDEQITIEQMNQLSINTAAQKMPYLKLYLPNLLQFYKK